MKNTSVIDGDYNKIIYIYKYLTETIKYNDEDDDDYNIYGALINGKATCEGFAETFQYLLLLSDIDCMCVVGEMAWGGRSSPELPQPIHHGLRRHPSSQKGGR